MYISNKVNYICSDLYNVFIYLEKKRLHILEKKRFLLPFFQGSEFSKSHKCMETFSPPYKEKIINILTF